MGASREACQDLSVAGKRAGLGGERSGLFWEIVRIAKDVRPPFLLLENVPGLLSSNGGADIDLILDALHEAGYLTEVEECDSQHFGVPQRRRRLFFIGVDAASGLQKPTHFSSVTLAAVVAQSLLDAWELLGPPSGTAPLDSGSGGSLPAVTGLLRRMRTYAASQAPSMWPQLLDLLAERRMQSKSEPESWACPSESHQLGLSRSGGKGTSSRVVEGAADDGISTERSWQRLWGDLWTAPSASTISTWSSTTTAETICICAEATLTTFALIEALSGSCPHCWNAASLSLTALLACIDSLDRLTDDLFVEATWRDRAGVLLDAAEAATCRAFARPTEAGVSAVLALFEGGGGNSEAGGEAGAGIARAARVGVDLDRAITSSIPSGQDDLGGPDDNEAQGGHHVTHALTGEGHDASEDGTGRGIPLIAFDTTQITSQLNRNNPKPGDPCHPLAAGAHPPAIAFRGDDASTFEAYARTVLHRVRNAVGAEAFEEWGARVLDSLQPEAEAVLQSFLHGEKLRCTASQIRSWLDDGTLPREEDHPARALLRMWKTECLRRASQEWQLAGQLAGELGAALSRLSSPRDLGRTKTATVRRLTPVEAERLQGFTDGWTCLCQPLDAYAADPDAAALACTCHDSQRYQALGNAVTVPVVAYLGHRLMEVIRA